jgi:DNA helicase HerA-like ATPase
VPCLADASGFNRHTFLCGQSGSGKTYSLGVILERLLLETDLRMVVLYPNSDFVRLGNVRDGGDPVLAERYERAARAVAVYSADAPGERRLRLHAAEIDPVTHKLVAISAENTIRIAAEGRKFGLYLLASTQRPQKIAENVLSQADNLVLMRMNSLADTAFAAAAFSFVPPSLIERSVIFRQGEALIAGMISPQPALARVGARITEEGGADVPATWAAAR